MSSYRIAVNVEWTSHCNALCAMCPRDLIAHPRLMTLGTWTRLLERIAPGDVFRGVIAGYGEPTTHNRFFDFVDRLRGHPVPFDMVSNGQQLDERRIRHLDGAIGTLLVSFSSIDPQVYGRVHVNLDHDRVKKNLRLAQRLLKRTRLAVSLTPMPECLPSLPATIAWLRAQGIGRLTMSPTLYNRGGNLQGHELASAQLRAAIRHHRLRSQEFDFVAGVRDSIGQLRANRFRCAPRNVDLLISATGDYLYCYNDVRHEHVLGHVADTGVREALTLREGMDAIPSLCDGCNMRDRYGAKELVATGLSWVRARLAQSLAGT